MQIAIRMGGPVGVYVALDGWLHGGETDEHHVLVPVDTERVEALWAIRRKPKAVAQFIFDHGEQPIMAVLAERVTPTDAEREAFCRLVADALPSLRSAVEALPDELPQLLWRLAASFAEGWARFSAMAPAVLVEAKRGELAQIVMALAVPSLLGYGAMFDERAGLLQEAASVCVVRPVHNVGLGPEVMHLDNRRAIVRPSTRRIAGHESIFIVTRAEWEEALDELAAASSLHEHEREVVAAARKQFDEAPGERFFHAITKWDDFVLACAADIDEGNGDGVFVRATLP